ncbi:unnamed protein product [Toxocara canis]|uniref:Myosin motor domain-containing protein n=1 Tax=Toxocara canis TaxID=6265 RepID=A0A183V9C5_TOXCA|nr:unnamed protein product [Toxocara canis]
MVLNGMGRIFVNLDRAMTAVDVCLNDIGDLWNGVLLARIWSEYVIGGRALNEFEGDTLLHKVAHAAEEVLGIPLGLIPSDGSQLDAKSLALFARIYLNCVPEWNRLAEAAITIQRAYRSYRIRKRVVRGWIARNRYRKMKSEKQEGVADSRYAVIIQSCARGFLARRSFAELKAKKDLEKCIKAAIIIQVRFWKHSLKIRVCDSL